MKRILSLIVLATFRFYLGRGRYLLFHCSRRRPQHRVAARRAHLARILCITGTIAGTASVTVIHNIPCRSNSPVNGESNERGGTRRFPLFA